MSKRGTQAAATAIAPSARSRLLTAVADLDTWRPLDRVVAVSVVRVLAVAWNPGRLARCKQRLAAGERAPALHVSRYWLHGEPWYLLSDGNHRAVAAREAGLTRIRARIGGEVWCDPANHVLDDRRQLWRKIVDERFGPCLRMVPVDVDDELAAALLAVGVEGVETK